MQYSSNMPVGIKLVRQMLEQRAMLHVNSTHMDDYEGLGKESQVTAQFSQNIFYQELN